MGRVTSPASSKTSQRALLSVTDKTGLVEFAKGLAELGFEIVSTGGTAKSLEAASVPVTPLERVTGWPEMLDGRVKTLHPLVHGGILARRDLPAHLEQASQHGIGLIDVVAVNLYDFGGAVARAETSFEEAVEQIDIGGPALLRASAKNHAFVLPVVDPDDYPRVLEALRAGERAEALRRALARKVFAHTARYDAAIARYLAGAEGDGEFPEPLVEVHQRVEVLRYGENPHQGAAFYRPPGAPSGLAAATQLQGKELSYNNLLDLDAALGLTVDLGTGAAGAVAVYIKHNNPCGAAAHLDAAQALATARACDPVSAFGAVVAVSRSLDRAAAEVLTESFVEAVIAPDFSPEALAVLAGKKNLRVLRLPDDAAWRPPVVPGVELRPVRGGVLAQTRDAAPTFGEEVRGARVVTRRAPSPAELAGLGFAWAVAKHVRSNAIVFALHDRVMAVGAGQMSRVDSVKICRQKAGEGLQGTVVASDAFFPFRDGVDHLAEAGATAIVQPGGSVRDPEVIAAADERGVAMIFTGVRHFRH